MGSPFAPNYAYFFMGMWEGRHILNNNPFANEISSLKGTVHWWHTYVLKLNLKHFVTISMKLILLDIFLWDSVVKKIFFWTFITVKENRNLETFTIEKKLTEIPFYIAQVSTLITWLTMSHAVNLWDWEEYVVMKRITKLKLKKCFM